VSADNIYRSTVRRSFFVAKLLLAFGALARAEPTTSLTASDELKQLNDQTLLVPYVSLETDWDEFKDASEKATWTFTGLWAWRVSDCQDWAIRLKLPFIYQRTPSGSDHHDSGGTGDVEIGTGTAFRLNDKWRSGGGVELHGDTASDSLFAENVWRLKWGWGIAHDFTEWFSLTANAEYNRSIAEQNNARRESLLEMTVPATFILAQQWSVSAKYRAIVDFNNGDRWIHTLTAGIAKRLSKVPVVVSAALEKPLGSGGKRYELELTVVYYF
jgi:hypothetical protein